MIASRLFLSVFAVFGMAILAYGYYTDNINLWYLLPVVFLAIGSYVFQYQINSFWDEKFGIRIDPYLIKWVEQNVHFFDEANPNVRGNMILSLAKQIRNTEYISMSDFTIAEEMKIMSVIPSICLGFDWRSKAAKDYQRVVLYKHPFMSPDFQQVHISETHHQDGVLIFSLEHLQASYINPAKFFNTAIYEWCQIFCKLYEFRFEDKIESLESELGISIENLKIYTGLDQMNISALWLYIYLMDTKKFNLTEFHFLMPCINIIKQNKNNFN